LTAVLDEQLQAAKELVARAGEVLSTAGWKVTTFVGEGDPKSMIVDHNSGQKWTLHFRNLLTPTDVTLSQY
jgi:hypothetical protein